MDPQRYARVKEIFREALRWAPNERAAVVATLAEGDTAVRDEVLSLLAHHDDAPLIREPAPNLLRASGPPPAEATPPHGSRTGDKPPPVETPAPPPAGSPAATTSRVQAAPPHTRGAADAPAPEALPPAHDPSGGPSSAPSGATPGDPSEAKKALVEKQTLAELLRGERAGGAAAGWPLDRVIRTLDPVARALASAADRGGVHGLIRAAHILLARVDGDLVAELAGPGQLPPTSGPRGEHAAGQIDGADAAAAAPEQLLPVLGPTGPWTDVYALALLCVELMLGRPAVEGSASAALARTRDEAAQPTPRAVGLEVPAAVEEVMRIALAMRPMERYQHVRRFWTALRDSLAASPPAPASRPPRPPSVSPGRPATRWSRARRRSTAALAVTLAVAVVAAVATVVAVSCC